MLVLRSDIQEDANQVIAQAEQVAPYPLFVKPANLGSSVGVSKCNNRSYLLEGLLEAARYDRRILIERGVNAREIEVSVLGNASMVMNFPCMNGRRPSAGMASRTATRRNICRT